MTDERGPQEDVESDNGLITIHDKIWEGNAKGQ